LAKLDKVDTLRTFAEYLCRTASKTYYRDNPCKEFTDISYALAAFAESSLQKTVFDYDWTFIWKYIYARGPIRAIK